MLIATRAEDEAADAEYEAFRRLGGLREDELLRVRLESGPMPALDVAELSGVIVGGSPFSTSDPVEKKSPTQRRVERELHHLLDRVIEEDTPFLGACFGIGTLGVHQGARVDRTYGEPIGGIPVTLTEEGLADPLLRAADLGPRFTAFVGHKEAVRELPEGPVLLARGDACPVQMFRVGRRQYATQFHPELDVDGIVQRIRIYRDAGYFSPDEMDDLIERVRAVQAREVPRLVGAFVELFAR